MLAAPIPIYRPKTDFIQDDGKMKIPKEHLSPWSDAYICHFSTMPNPYYFSLPTYYQFVYNMLILWYRDEPKGLPACADNTLHVPGLCQVKWPFFLKEKCEVFYCRYLSESSNPAQFAGEYYVLNYYFWERFLHEHWTINFTLLLQAGWYRLRWQRLWR